MTAAGAMAISAAVLLIVAGVLATAASDLTGTPLGRQCQTLAWAHFVVGVPAAVIAPWLAVQS